MFRTKKSTPFTFFWLFHPNLLGICQLRKKYGKTGSLLKERSFSKKDGDPAAPGSALLLGFCWEVLQRPCAHFARAAWLKRNRRSSLFLSFPGSLFYQTGHHDSFEKCPNYFIMWVLGPNIVKVLVLGKETGGL